MRACFTTAYLPTIAWFQEALKYPSILIEARESWQKQSYRNRSYILGPNGPMMLNIPVDHQSTSGTIDEVKISYTENWQHRHWQAILSAYGSAPFFESLSVELEVFYKNQTDYLLEYNNQLLKLILSWLQYEIDYDLTKDWHAEHTLDQRERFHPKRQAEIMAPYPQVFDEQLGFTPNLSVIDLIFNEGRWALDYLVG